ncbi:hypothetical protein OS493_015787 [Desmophyllum pertusum]|uniref:Uncharacterized protein n=1 Tax=Desmophyllum pertusum TaxID=174260 RepID=A0A9W9YCG6_9CNID|nr:hypothetical protein OS493_015787 [Desmophyllum pertusum]
MASSNNQEEAREVTASDDKALNSNEQTEESSDLLSAKTESNTVEQEEPQAAHAQHGSDTDGSATTADHQDSNQVVTENRCGVSRSCNIRK